MQILRQGLHKPLKQHEEVIILLTSLARLYVKFPISQITNIKEQILEYFNKNEQTLCQNIEINRVLTEELKEEIINKAKTFLNAGDLNG